MPAEWAAHQCTWFSWPHNAATWPGGVEAAEQALVPAVAALEVAETVRINVLDMDHEHRVRRLLAAAGAGRSVRFHHVPTNDAWCRDHGALFVTRPRALGEPLLALDFDYNAWGGK